MIIDASVAVKWLFPEEGHEKARDWAAHEEMIAPTLLHAEVGNAIWKRAMRGELRATGAEVGKYLEKVASIVETIDETPMMPRAVELAIELRHPLYDCVYLALAEELGENLLTADERFWEALHATRFGQMVQRL